MRRCGKFEEIREGMPHFPSGDQAHTDICLRKDFPPVSRFSDRGSFKIEVISTTFYPKAETSEASRLGLVTLKPPHSDEVLTYINRKGAWETRSPTNSIDEEETCHLLASPALQVSD